MKQSSQSDIHIVQRMEEHDWPFAIREFTEWRKAPSPIAAGEIAVADVLHRLAQENPEQNRIVSVTDLCRFLGIKLEGAKHTLSKNSLKLDKLPTSRRRGFLGTLSFRDGRPIIDVRDDNPSRARLSIAHEIGHFLIHRRDNDIDWITLRSNSTSEEEVLAEYMGRLLLLPRAQVDKFIGGHLTALRCVELARKSYVSIHAAAARLVDPDRTDASIIGIILWRLAPQKDLATDQPLAHAFVPEWHLCPGKFIPVNKCHIRNQSVLGELVSANQDAQGRREEDVAIGTLKGRFVVDGFAWGSLENRTRRALSIFLAH